LSYHDLAEDLWRNQIRPTTEFEFSERDKSQDLDSGGAKVTTVKCHGNIVAETRHRVEQIFKENSWPR